MNTTVDSTKFFLGNEDYLTQPYSVTTPSSFTGITTKVETFPDTPVIYNHQSDDESFYVGYQEQGSSSFEDATNGDVYFQPQHHLAPPPSSSSNNSSLNTPCSSSSISSDMAAVVVASAAPVASNVMANSVMEATGGATPIAAVAAGEQQLCQQPDTPISCCTSPAPLPTTSGATTNTASPSPITPVYPSSDFLQFAKDTVPFDHHQQPMLVQPNNNNSTTTAAVADQQRVSSSPTHGSKRRHPDEQQDDEDIEDPSSAPASAVSNSELRRQIHIQSEQKRRAQIKDGFEDLRNELPSCLNKKMSKVALLHRTVQHIQHLKNTQMTILAELERLVNENEQLRKFQQCVLQKQALEKMYQVNNL